MNLKILYEDNHVISVEKPSGILAQRDITGKESILDYVKQYIKEKYNKPGNVYAGLVHRLDKPVSGAILFAKTSKSARRLFKEFKDRHVKKIYIALVHTPKNKTKTFRSEGKWIELKQKIVRDHDKTNVITEEDENSKDAVLNYLIITSNEEYTLLLIDFITGRKHQIRAQLSSIEMPIVGDTKYGSSVKLKNDAICLHSHFIRFNHPTLRKFINIYSEPPSRITSRININIDINKYIKKNDYDDNLFHI